MKNVEKSVLIWYSPQEMYNLVTDVNSYPSFLPWCSSADILETTPEGVMARLGIGYAGIKQHFTTRNHNVPGKSVTMDLVDGPFSALKGVWTFTALPPVPPQTEPPRACRIHFQISYAFSSRPLEFLIGPVFDRITKTFVDAFIKRAHTVYGSQ